MEAEHGFVGEVILTQFVVGIYVDEEGFADFWQVECDVGEGLNGSSGHLDIDIGGIIIELIEQITQIILIGKLSKNFNF